ncbi:type II toxin-antitoxin system HicB family antitoxin [Acetanaerobacterium elongatum]|uniref:HicB family protein n=1 Tax=Acetanaerobacterium elongatum TaxID=258515 RepID=A0A1G9XT45_9FIRM|nr:type II toxin-antitoxin system HicB family antitoxin [Acetanaerobacterium elongatum]SDM99978.1 HicB family protein [Acetanaerobacterium elongatum]
MNYAFQITPTQVDGQYYWSAESTVLKGCAAQGETLAEAIARLEVNEREWLSSAQKHGIPIPEQGAPPEEYNGKLTIRLSKTLHRQLMRYAERENITVNQFISDAVAQRIGYHNGLKEARETEALPPSV